MLGLGEESEELCVITLVWCIIVGPQLFSETLALPRECSKSLSCIDIGDKVREVDVCDCTPAKGGNPSLFELCSSCFQLWTALFLLH